MTPQCHGGVRSSFADLQRVAVEVVRGDNLVAKAAIELHFVFHVNPSLIGAAGMMSEMGIFHPLRRPPRLLARPYGDTAL